VVEETERNSLKVMIHDKIDELADQGVQISNYQVLEWDGNIAVIRATLETSTGPVAKDYRLLVRREPDPNRPGKSGRLVVVK